MRKEWFILFLFCFLIQVVKCENIVIEKKATDFVSTNFLNEEEIEKIKELNHLVGSGEATYEFNIPESGWYEFYVQAAKWDTNLYLDGKFLIYTPFDSGVWESKERDTYKVMNVYLTKGTHKLKFSCPWYPGLPWMTKFYFKKSENITGMVRLKPERDYLVFRKGEEFPLKLIAGKLNNPYKLFLSITDVQKNTDLKTEIRVIPAGEGNYQELIEIPTDREGVFDIKIKDEKGNFCTRIIQYLVIDTEKNPLRKGGNLKKELLYVIDCAKVKPDYYSSPTRVINSPIGSYRESGPMGRERGSQNADWFAYTLKIPEIQKPYLVEIEYPDNERRTTAIVLVERLGAPQPAVGYFSGGFYPLSYKMQKMEFYIFPRDKDPRLLFYNWDTGRRAAVSKIYVYRIKEFTALPVKNTGRLFGIYQEEPLRYTYFYGAMAKGDEWLNLWKPAERVCTLANYSGINLWYPTIAIYQCRLWPSKYLPGYKIGLFPPGPYSPKQPVETDVMRLMLLTCEKYNMKFIGELHIPFQWDLMEYLDKRCGGKGSLKDNGYQKPWLIVSNKGEIGLITNYKPYVNPLYPGIQEWAADIVREIGERYKNIPSFKGLSLRLSSWVPSGWKTFGSINWGYGDYTISLFEKETGIKIPVDKNDPERFKKRYEFLISKHYDEWVKWRCEKIYQYHSKLAKILTDIRPDLKLYILLTEANFAYDATETDYERRGWLGVLKEAGIDPSLYKKNPSIILYGTHEYPDGGNRGDERPLKNAFNRDHSFSTAQIKASEKPLGDGTIAALFFSTNHEGLYTKYDKLGYTKEESKGHLKVVYPDSTVNPAGINYLERYANAMADGNMVFLADGCHGYEIGQPQYLREFLREYRSLPLIGMKPFGNCDPVGLWYGKDKGKTYFYIVNRTYYPVKVKISFENGKVKIKQLSTDKKIRVWRNTLNVNLKPYQLISYVETNGSIPVSIKTKIPEKEKKLLEKQIKQAEDILEGNVSSPTVLPLSIKDLKKAEKKLEEAKEFFKKGMYWKTRQTLMHRYLIKIYQEVGAFPEKLFFSTIIKIPENALLPEEIFKKVKNKKKVDVVDGGEINKYFSDIKVLLCRNNTEIDLDIPFKNLYRICYEKLRNGDMEIFVNGEKIEKQGIEKAMLSEKIVSKPVILDKGKKKLVIKTKREIGLLFLLLKPIYTDIKPEDFFVIGPFEGANSIFDVKNVIKKMNEVGEVEKNLDLKKEYVGIDGKKIKWKRGIEGRNMSDMASSNYVDLYKTTGFMRDVISYAYTTIECPEEREAEISFGVDYWGKIWVNGKVVYTFEKRPEGPPRKGESKIPVKLKKGKNTILIKIHAGSGGNGFWFSITNPGDLKIGGEI